MATYTKTTNFTAKDNLTSGDPAKVIKGSEFDTEFNAIETAVNSKANANNGTHTGTTTISTANIDTLQIDSVAVTATSAELNTLDGYTGDVTDLNKLASVTATATEINVLDGSTATTADLNKLAGVTATSTELNLLDGVTATTTELNYVDGVTSSVQTQLDGKQPLDAQLTDIAGLTPADGTFIVGDGTNFVAESGDTAIASLGVTATASELNTLDGVTSTTAEINKLDGFTGTVDDLNYAKDLRATGVTTAEFDKLDGLTATTSELNVLDGITATTTELNYTDGVTSNIQTQLNAMVEKTGDTMTGDLSLGDNVKAKFGASDDLQIYHDGSNSYIGDFGTGNLNIRGANLQLQDPDGYNYITAVDNGTGGEIILYHNNSAKLATTSTGVDVTGTVTADGLTVDGTTGLNWAAGASSSGLITIGDGGNSGGSAWFNTPSLSSVYNSGFGISGSYGSNLSTIELGAYGVKHPSYSSEMSFLTQDVGTSAVRERLKIHNNGDVHLYEDTGTTAKMVWDASAESLAIGTTADTGRVFHVKQNGNYPCARFEGKNGGYSAIEFSSHDNDATVGALSAWSGTVRIGHREASEIGVDTSKAIIIDSSGNVGIGTSPTQKLDVLGSGDTFFKLGNGSYNTYIGTESDGTRVGNDDNKPIKFYVESTERARLDSQGNLLVGKTSSNGRKLEVAGEFDYKVATFSAGSSTDILLGVAGSAVVTLMVDVANTQNDNSHASYLLFATTRFSGYGGGNAVNVVSSAHNSTGVSTEPSGITFSIVASGNNIYLRVSGTTVGGTGTLRVQVREIGMQ